MGYNSQQGKGLDKLDRGDWLEMVRKDVEGLPAKFEEFYTPGPSEFTAKLDLIDELTRKLDTRQGQYSTGEVKGMLHEAMDHMDQWQGALGISFRREYLTPMYEAIVPNHGRMLAMMHDNFQAMRNIYAEGRRSLKKIGEKGVTAMEQADDVKGSAVVTALTVLMAAFGIGVAALAAVPSLAVKAGITGAVVTGGLAVASDQAPEDAEDLPLAGSTVQEVLGNIYSALEQLRSDITEKENELILAIAKGCNEALPLLGNTTEMTLLVPLMPELVHTVMDDIHKIPDALTQSE